MKKLKVNKNLLSEKSLRSYDIPDYYYDETINCEECNKSFVFTKEEQQKWYEVQRKYFWMRPKYCDVHYQKWLVRHKSKIEMDKNLKELGQTDSLKVMYNTAESIYQYYLLNKHQGNIEKVRHLLKKCIDAKHKIKQSEKILVHIHEIEKNKA